MIKLTEQDKALFEALHNSNMGKQLVDYIKRFSNQLADIRNIKHFSQDSMDTLKDVLSLLKSDMIDRIELQNEKKSITNKYE